MSIRFGHARWRLTAYWRLAGNSASLSSSTVLLGAGFLTGNPKTRRSRSRRLATDESPFQREGAARKPQAGCNGQGVGPRKRRYACTVGTGLGALTGQRRCAHPWDKASSLFAGEHGCNSGERKRERPEKYRGAPHADSSRRRALRTRNDVPGATRLRMSGSVRYVYPEFREVTV